MTLHQSPSNLNLSEVLFLYKIYKIDNVDNWYSRK